MGVTDRDWYHDRHGWRRPRHRTRECAGLDAAIRALDTEARGALSGYRQDQIRAERQQVMSRRFALRC